MDSTQVWKQDFSEFSQAQEARREARHEEAEDHGLQENASIVLPLAEDVWENSLDWWDQITLQQILLLNAPTI
eukprot:8790146-Prorocentrum_lima.AAC.1